MKVGGRAEEKLKIRVEGGGRERTWIKNGSKGIEREELLMQEDIFKKCIECKRKRIKLLKEMKFDRRLWKYRWNEREFQQKEGEIVEKREGVSIEEERQKGKQSCTKEM